MIDPSLIEKAISTLFDMPIDDVLIRQSRGVPVLGRIATGILVEGLELDIRSNIGQIPITVSGFEIGLCPVSHAISGEYAGVYLKGVDYEQIPRGSHLTSRVEAIEAYLQRMVEGAETIEEFNTVGEIGRWLLETGGDWRGRREAIELLCEEIVGQPQWGDRVIAGLGSAKEKDFEAAAKAADFLKIDAFDIHWNRLVQSTMESRKWEHVLNRCDDRQAWEAVVLAEKMLYAGNESKRPDSEFWENREKCLEVILKGLGRFPGCGYSVIKRGLVSKWEFVRSGAIRALTKWGKLNWPKGCEEMLRKMLNDEPQERVQENIRKALRGQFIE